MYCDHHSDDGLYNVDRYVSCFLEEIQESIRSSQQNIFHEDIVEERKMAKEICMSSRYIASLIDDFV